MKKNIVLSVVGLLALVGAILLIAHVTYDPLLLLYDEDRALTFEGALAIAEELDRIADDLEPPLLPANNSGLFLLSVEIVPYYHYENISDQGAIPVETAVFFQLRPPDCERNFHNLGVCYVGPRPQITLNARLVNPASSWYLQSYFAVLVHELGHSQGVYRLGDASTEPATQLATVEILAAMAGDGNVWALPSFIREVQGYAQDWAWSYALKNNRLADFEAHVRRVGNTAYSESRFARSMRHWSGDMRQLRMILTNYGEVPYRLLVKALNRRTLLTDRLEPFPNAIHRIFMDDTHWNIQHLREMARDYPDLLEIYYERHEE